MPTSYPCLSSCVKKYVISWHGLAGWLPTSVPCCTPIFLTQLQDELVWNDGVAPEACLDFDAPHISKWTALAWWVGAFVFLYANYKLITLFDVQNWKKTVRVAFDARCSPKCSAARPAAAACPYLHRLLVSFQKPAVLQRACMMMRTTRLGHALSIALTKLLLVTRANSGQGWHAVELPGCMRARPPTAAGRHHLMYSL